MNILKRFPWRIVREIELLKQEQRRKNLISERDVLLRQIQKMQCDALYRNGFLPEFMDANRGQISVELTTYPIRDQFCTRAMLTISDDMRRYVMNRINPRIFEVLGKQLGYYASSELKKQFEPHWPGDR